MSPSAAGTLWVPHAVKLHAAVSHGFRLPTYLDLYYSDPATLGNPNLKPESAWNYEVGAGWYPGSRVTATLIAFYSRQKDTIDHTRASPADPWQASNLSGLSFTGVEAALDWQVSPSQQFKLSWTLLDGAQKALHGLQSEYVFNYPVNNARAQWTWSLKQQFEGPVARSQPSECKLTLPICDLGRRWHSRSEEILDNRARHRSSREFGGVRRSQPVAQRVAQGPAACPTRKRDAGENLDI